MANALRALIQFYRSGETADRVKYDIAWVADKASPVDTINGFIEVYMDPRGIKGSWEALVFYVNPEKAERIKALGAAGAVVRGSHAVRPPLPQAERHRHRRQRDRRRHRNGRLGADHADRHQPAERRADPRALRQQVGGAGERDRGVQRVDARTACTRSSRGTRRKPTASKRFRSVSDELHTELHEVLGHASGRQAPGFKGSPDEIIKEHYSALEEARADLIALYLHRRSQARRAGHRPGRRPRATSSARSTTTTRATRSCSCAAFARARRSRKRTCATGR